MSVRIFPDSPRGACSGGHVARRLQVLRAAVVGTVADRRRVGELCGKQFFGCRLWIQTEHKHQGKTSGVHGVILGLLCKEKTY